MRYCTFIPGIIAAGILSAAAAAQPVTPQITVETAPSAVVSGAEMICRKVKDTGSLIKSKKTCHTRSQWSYIDEQHQRFGRQIVQDGTTRPAGN